jgi:hypothetical protein
MSGVRRRRALELIGFTASEGIPAVDPRFPWGSNRPTRRQRVVVAIAIAAVAALILAREYNRDPAFKSDFGIVWFGAKTMLAGADPYDLVGPGKPYPLSTPLLYPGTAFVAGIPFTVFSERVASLLFVSISTFLLAYGMTAKSWHLLPMFVTEAFASSARLAQWSLVLTAAFFIPGLAFLIPVKPQNGLPVIAGSFSRSTLRAGLSGAIILMAVSLIFLPAWPVKWLGLLGTAHHMGAPVTRAGGPLVLLALLRWRRWEAWLLLALACMPYTWGWYNVLMLYVIPATWREACVLALISSAGAVLAGYLIQPGMSLEAFQGATIVVTGYLPATLMVLRRPNTGPGPAWLTYLERLGRSATNRDSRSF